MFLGWFILGCGIVQMVLGARAGGWSAEIGFTRYCFGIYTIADAAHMLTAGSK